MDNADIDGHHCEEYESDGRAGEAPGGCRWEGPDLGAHPDRARDRNHRAGLDGVDRVSPRADRVNSSRLAQGGRAQAIRLQNTGRPATRNIQGYLVEHHAQSPDSDFSLVALGKQILHL